MTLEDSARSVAVTLTPEDLATLNRAAPKGATAGPRYGKLYMSMVDRSS